MNFLSIWTHFFYVEVMEKFLFFCGQKRLSDDCNNLHLVYTYNLLVWYSVNFKFFLELRMTRDVVVNFLVGIR